ncbi:MAG: extracellular solute-binding protein [Ruminococcaceae bacterium]|nr:extracellular solute-binding protein [Oscillospiraceae bacterium]
MPLFLLVCSLDFEVLDMILYMHINLLFAFALFPPNERGAGFGGKHMKFLKLKKVLAGTLAFAMLAGCAFGASAATVSSSGSSSSSTSVTDETLDQLNDLTWSEYYAEYAGMPKYAGKDVVINAADYTGFEYPDGYSETDAAVPFKVIDNLDGKKAVQTPDIGKTTWTVEVPESGLYAIDINYYPTEAKSANIERTIFINDDVLFSEVRNVLLTKIWQDDYLKNDAGEIYFETDENGNESRPIKIQTPEWRTYTVSDPSGYYNGEFLFYLEKGTNTIALEAQKEPMAVESIVLRAPKDTLTYEEYLAQHEALGHKDAPVNENTRIFLEAEKASATSDSTLYPTNNKTSPINSPSSAKCTLINSIGGSNWATLGQWIEWEFDVKEAGFYTINVRYSQNTNQGIFVSRRMRVDGEIPFEEANNLQFMYGSEWQIIALTDGSYDFKIYLEEGKHTFSLEVTLGNLGDIISRVRAALASINEVYLKILQITGPNPDSYTNYKFYSRIPAEIEQMGVLAHELFAISEEFQRVSGETSSNTATLENVARILEKMAKDSEGQIAKNFETLKSNIGTLGTWINNVQKQALTIDYILIQPENGELPKAEANFFQNAWYEIQSFFYSFFIDYNSFGSKVEGEDIVEVEVWTVVSREYTQIIRNLVDDDFTKSYPNISVNLKLVAGGALLPASLAGVGPDVMMGSGESTVINYAVRGALLDMSVYEEFPEVCARFLPETLVPLTVALGSPDGELATYGIPHTMGFSVMFYRTDIFAENGFAVPKTWDEFRALIPKLQGKNYDLGMTRNVDMFVLQNGGSIFAEDGAKINYGDNIALDAFTTMCEFFTLYRLPISYDAANRFRTGEMPLIFADLTSFYNQFTAFATELKGLWSFTNVPGTVQEDGSINDTNIVTVSSLIMMKDAKERGRDAAAFKFIEWWTRSNIQSQYAKELIAFVGPSTKYNTANIEAYEEMDWSAKEIRLIKECASKLAGVPDMPGAYIIGRYTNFAFLAAYNDNASPSDELLGYVPLINKEFERKREELSKEFFIPTTYDWS